MRKTIVSLALLLPVIFSGCSNELGFSPRELSGTEAHAGQEVGVRFVLRAPSPDPVVFTRAIQTKNETLIETLDIYQFTGSAGNEVLEESYLGQKFTRLKDGVSLVLKVKGTGTKRFAFVVNNKGAGRVASIANVRSGMRLSDFQKQVTESLGTSALSTPLLMEALSGEVDVKDGMPAQQAELRRIMARLDIKNYEPHLTLKHVRLENVNDRSYLMHVGAPGDAQTVPGTQVINLPVVELPAQPTAAGEDPAVAMEVVADRVVNGVIQEPAHTLYKHVCYPFVSDVVTDAAKAPVLVIEGTLFKGDPEREHDVVYKKVLKLDGEATNYLGFARNHRYTVAIKGGTIPGEADIKVYVDRWNLVELPIETVEPIAPTVGSLMSAELFFNSYVKGVSYTSPSQTWNGAAQVENRSGAQVQFMVNANTDWDITVDGTTVLELNKNNAVNSWLTVVQTDSSLAPPCVDYYGVYHPYHTIPYVLTLGFTEANNTGVNRSVTLLLRSKVNPSLRSEFTVTQSASNLI